jgi:hypothetical protein
MARLRLLTIAIFVVALSLAWGGTAGTFRGRVVQPPPNSSSDQGWIYIEGRNHLLRRVQVGKAEVVYAAEVPKSDRHGAAAASLVEGTEVRVTAEQVAGGEWQARRIEVLRVAPAIPMPDEPDRRKPPVKI